MIGSRLSVNYFGKMIDVCITSATDGDGSSMTDASLSSGLDALNITNTAAGSLAGNTITAITFELCARCHYN